MVQEKMFSYLKVSLITLCALALFVIPTLASASSDFYLSPANGTYIIGHEFTVSVLVDTNEDDINTAVANLNFDTSKFAVTSIDKGTFKTCFPDDPSFDNATIKFGCTILANGCDKSDCLVVKIHLKGVSLGTGQINFLSNPTPEIYLNSDYTPGQSRPNVIGQTTGGEYTIIPEPLSVSCSALPSSATPGQDVIFSANPSGGTGSNSFKWENGACLGESKDCKTSFTTTGNKTAHVTVTDSSNKTASADCTAAIGNPGLNVSCYSSKETADTGESVLFSATANGGDGSYNYSWSGDCKQPDNLPDCANSFDTSGLKKTTVSVTSGGKASSADCNVYVGEVCPVQPDTSHTICHNQKCEYVFGEGTDGCRQDSDCEIVPDIIQIIIPTIDEVKKFVNTPVGSVATKTATTVGLVATALVVSPLSLPELFMLPTRLLGLLLMAFGWKKRNPPWGVVYDSITKQPLDPAYVALKDMNGRDISTAITDLDGRYGFLANPGIYKMTANKTNYLFPSQKLAGKTSDEFYNNLYFGDQVEIKKGEVVIKNIPLDPIKFDWNEFQKKNKKLTRFYSRWDMLLRKISDALYYIGFILALFAVFAAPYPYNSIIFGLYVFLLVLRIFGVRPKPYGSVTDIDTGNPVPFAILRVMEKDTGVELSHRLTDKYGRYFCLVPKGRYYVKIEYKNADESYSPALTSGLIDASKTGIIKNKFQISQKPNTLSNAS